MELQRRRDCLLLGICLGLAYLTRAEAFVYVPFFVAAFLTAGLLRKKARAAVMGSAIMVAAFFVLASPYVAFLYSHTGSLRLQAKWDMNYTMARHRLAGMSDTEAEYGIEKDLTIKGPMLAPSEFADGTPYSHTLVDKLSTLASMVNYNKWAIYNDFLSSEIGSPIVLGLIVLGLFRQPWSNRRVEHEAVLLVMAASIILIVLASPAAAFRYFLPIVPLLLLWAGKGVDELRHWVTGSELLGSGRSSFPNLIAVALQLCAIAPMIVLSARGVQREGFFVAERSSTALAARDAALWLAHYEPGPKRIAVRYALIPYYAKGTLIGLPYADPDSTMRYVAAKNVDFIVLESAYPRLLPAIGEWIAHGIPNARARLVYDRTNASGDRVIIYRWQKSSGDDSG